MKIALPFPRNRGDAPEQPPVVRRRFGGWRVVVILVGLGLIIAGIWQLWRTQLAPSAAAPSAAVLVTAGDLAIDVESSGAVKPAKDLELPFQIGGKVQEVLVKPGDSVAAGQLLARLDDRELRLGVQQAEASLKMAQARLAKAHNGDATPQDMALAQSNLKAAEAQLQRTRTGNVTSADLRQAEAALRAAQARLDALQNPSSDKISAARLALTQAQTALQTTRDSLSAAKTNAEQDLSRAAQSLTQAQSSYSTALQNWRYVQDTGKDPYNPTTTDKDGKSVANRLNDAERQKYYDAFVQAEAALHSAEAAVKQAQVGYDTARQREAAEIQAAEATTADAQQQLDALLHPGKADLAQAQANVVQAQAQLDKLRQGGTAADLIAAQAQVDKAQIDLQKLTAPAASADITAAEADVAQAQAELDAAKLKLADATLTAPFAGTVAVVGIIPGSTIGAGAAAVRLVDMSAPHIDVNVNESDIGRVRAGQPVSITFDALPNVALSGTVESIATTATAGQNVVTYLVQVRLDPGDAAVKSDMSADVSIEVERHPKVLQVPSRAIKSAGGEKTVQVLYGANQTPVTVRVQTGATNGAMTEIVSCPDIGKQCLREGDRVVLNLPTGTASGGPDANGDFTVAAPGPPGGAVGGPVRIFKYGP